MTKVCIAATPRSHTIDREKARRDTMGRKCREWRVEAVPDMGNGCGQDQRRRVRNEHSAEISSSPGTAESLSLRDNENRIQICVTPLSVSLAHFPPPRFSALRC